MTSRNYLAVIMAAMLVLTAFASMPVAAASHESVEVETVEAQNVTAANATLVGNLTELDNASSADVWFEYWEQGDPANTSNSTEKLNQTAVGEFEFDVDELESDTTYVAVAHADTGNASDNGSTVTFTTDAVESVSVTTDEPTLVTDDSATLNGELTDLEGAENAEVWFEYWVEDDAANVTKTDNRSMTAPGSFNESVDELANNTTYVYVAHAATENVTHEGDPVEFTTRDRFAPLGVETHEATDVATTSATFKGELTGMDGEAEADVWFEYWVQGDAANVTTIENQTMTAPGSFNESVDKLESNTTYVYVAYAKANGTTVAGENESFTTDERVVEEDPTWDGEGAFGQWLTSILRNLVPPDSDVPRGQIVSDIVTANNPGSEHRSDKANPGGNGNGPPDHAKDKGSKDHKSGNGDELDIAFEGDTTANGTITVIVTHDDSVVENATVSVDGEEVGTTNAAGELEVTLPDEPGETITISAELDDLEGETELTLDE